MLTSGEIASTVGCGNGTVATSGVPFQLPNQSCKRVKLTCSAVNGGMFSNGIVVVGGSDVVADGTNRKGHALYPGQSEMFSITNLNLLWVDSTDSGAKFHYIYEN